MKFVPALVASVLFVTATATAKSCEELKIGEETIVPGEDYLHDRNAKLMTQQMLERDLPGNAYRGFSPQNHRLLVGYVYCG